MTPDVSVLIPAYNASKTIDTALKSCFKQCGGTSIEVVVCNDASTDDTALVIAEHTSLNEHIKVVTHDVNQGLAPALNTAASAATGRYFIELDADDWFASKCLCKLAKALDEHSECGFAYGQTQYHGLSDYLHVPQAYKPGLFNYGFDSLYGFMYRREAWDSGCRYRSTCTIQDKTVTIQDWDMVLQLLYYMRYEPFVLRDTLVLNYTHVHGSLTDFTHAHNGQVVRAFKERWPMVVTERI